MGSLALLLGIIVLPFFVTFFRVDGSSMEPTYTYGDMLAVERLSVFLVPPHRGELLVFRNPHERSQTDIKRVVGLPGEEVEVRNTDLRIVHADGTETQYTGDTLFGGGGRGLNGLNVTMRLGPEDYFVLGDNREASRDSRLFGAVQHSDMIGRVIMKL